MSPKWGYPNYNLLIILLNKSHEPSSIAETPDFGLKSNTKEHPLPWPRPFQGFPALATAVSRIPCFAGGPGPGPGPGSGPGPGPGQGRAGQAQKKCSPRNLCLAGGGVFRVIFLLRTSHTGSCAAPCARCSGPAAHRVCFAAARRLYHLKRLALV